MHQGINNKVDLIHQDGEEVDMLVIAISFIFAACILYTLGVWSEKIQKILKPWHTVVFWLGFVCDTIGTGAMGKLAGSILQPSNQQQEHPLNMDLTTSQKPYDPDVVNRWLFQPRC